jgi:hypothetical protein
MTTMTRQQEIHTLWKEYQGLYIVIGVLIGLLLFPLLEQIINNLSDLLIGLVPEAIGIGFTVFFVDRIYQHREITQLKKRLVREAGSRSNETAKAAVDWLRYEGWLTGDDGLLKGADLSFANLRGVRLTDANMKGTILTGADLTESNLFNANLQSASLSMAKLRETSMMYASLIQADLDGAILNKTNFTGANLSDACLLMATIEENSIIFESTIVDVTIKAILPDGSSGGRGDDLTRFFDPEHSDAFIPSWVDLEEKHQYW